MSKMHYRRFLIANALGRTRLGCRLLPLGLLRGFATPKIEKYSGWASIALVVLLVATVIGVHYARKMVRKRNQENGTV